MQQDFPRSELADWDASARAWLLTADEGKIRHQRQLMLIVNNINLPVSDTMAVYKSVIGAWKIALISMENLVKGVPQRVQTGALLLGLSAWHLYPDMVVYGAETKEIRMEDPLINVGGILTIGLQNDIEHEEGVYWSLPLAHLRYYGDPVHSSRSIGHDTSRVSVEQLSQVALGAVFSSWGYPPSNAIKLVRWFSDMYDFFHRIAAGNHETSRNRRARKQAQILLQGPGWPLMLMEAARSILESSENERRMSLKLVAFGQRRCGEFLAKLGRHPTPFLGLSNPIHLFPLLADEEDRIRILRNVVQNLDVDGSCLIIRYLHLDKEGDGGHYEYASVLPCARPPKRTHSGQQSVSTHHKRWVSMRLKNELMIPSSPDPCACTDKCKRCICRESQDECSEKCACQGGNKSPCSVNYSLNSRREAAEERAKQVLALGEDCSLQHLSDFCHARVRYPGPPTTILAIFKNTWVNKMCKDILIALAEAPWENKFRREISLETAEFFFGDVQTAAIYRLRPQEERLSTINRLYHQDLEDIWSRNIIAVSPLCAYIHDLGQGMEAKYFLSLRAIATALDIYKLLPGTTIDLAVTSRPFHEALWVSNSKSRCTHSGEGLKSCYFCKLSRAETFACVAMFESGSIDIDPNLLDEVMAMSSGNSIFVAAPLLCDPSEAPLEHEIRRVVGNIGRAGVAMLIPPQNCRVRKLKPDTWALINHLPFDGKLEDSFHNTSLHLSFTNYVMPINMGEHGTQDKEAFFVESLVSVHDRDKWIADLNILKMYKSPLFHRQNRPEECGVSDHTDPGPACELVAFDSWEELLDREHISGVARAHRNWLARLAAAVISVEQGYKTVVLSEPLCWGCSTQTLSDQLTTYIC